MAALSIPSKRRLANEFGTVDYLGGEEVVRVKTLRKARSAGDTTNWPPFLKLGRLVRYDLDDVDRWLETRKRGSVKPQPRAA